MLQILVLAGAGMLAPAEASDLAAANRLYFQGRPLEALAAYEAAARKDSPILARLNAALVLQELGRDAEAVRALESAARSDPSEVRVQSALAWAHLYNDDHAAAKKLFARALQARPARDLDLLGAAMAEIEASRYPAAVKLLESLLEKRPRLAVGHWQLGEARAAQGDARRALDSYQAVLKADSHFVEARPRLAVLFEGQKQLDEAWRQHAKVALVDPDAPDARDGKARLAPSLTRTPDRIMPARRIARHYSVTPAPGRERLPVLRVGLGTRSSGNPLPRRLVAWRAAGPFSLLPQKTGTPLVRGKARDRWTIRISSGDARAAEVLGPEGTVAASFTGSVLVRQDAPDGRTLIVDELTYAPGYSWAGTADKEVRGDLEVAIDPKGEGLLLINHVNLEEYLYGVLASEMPGNWPAEALKAQAVIARSQALYRRLVSRPHGARGYDLCDEQHCQVYGGVAAESRKAREAVDATHQEILSFNGRPAHTIFFSNCGGHTQSGAEVGWADLPYWQAVFDGRQKEAPPASPLELKDWLQGEPRAYCNIPRYISPPEFRWTRAVPARDLEGRLARKAAIGRIQAVTPLRRSASGRVLSIRIRGTAGDVVLDKEHEIRRTLGLGPLRSTLFVTETVRRKGLVDAVLFYGGGWGHGIGMCQAGAGGRAESGWSYQGILAHYFPGTKFEKLDAKGGL
jgi:SpoIID/LytB domain protein